MGIYFTVKTSLFYSFIVFEIIVSKKLSIPYLDGENSKNLGECSRCKVLVESFNHWLDKTSRGKFEGGDAAWEESKLKSYARSEIRLVEIQEGLCSELKKHQDPCYAIAEEAEHALEKWWFHEDTDSMELFTWLCVETLQDCCPQNHFGYFCKPCPLDKNNKLCDGHGRCNGEGTRQGNGSCICHKGYTGNYCEACVNDFYNAGLDCKPCHKACDGCSGEGATLCITCKSGWTLEDGACTDVDECSKSTTCKKNQYCINKEGSYTCKSCDNSCSTCVGGGVTNCTSCSPSSVLWSGVCVGSKFKEELLSDTLKRLALYFGLLVIILFINKTSKQLASIIVVVIVSFVYFSEKTARMNSVDVISNLYF